MDWKLLTKMYSMLEAQMLVGRLETEGIPAQAWQEGAGKAYGLTVGYLGEVRVMVMARRFSPRPNHRGRRLLQHPPRRRRPRLGRRE